MTKKDIAARLAESLRQARQPSAPPTPAPLPGGTPPARFARQADQSPPASLDRPWDNLHPERIWPD